MTENSNYHGHAFGIAIAIATLAIILLAGVASAEIIQVGIFIKDNTISLDTHENILIYILSTDSFDAPSQVDVSSVKFEGVEMQGSAENKIDVNGDGLTDLGLHFKSQGSSITCGNNRLVYLKGKTKTGTDIVGWSTITIKGCIYTSPPVVNITSSAPPSPINDTVGSTRTFNITVNQTVNVTWYINGMNGTLVPLLNESGVTESEYTNTSASLGTWNITVVAQNGSISSGNTDIRVWEWNINKVSPSISVTSSPNPSIFGQSITFTAAVSGVTPGAGTPTGTVSFNDNGVTIGTGTLNSSGQTAFSISNLSNDSHTITVVYSGDTNFSTSEGSLTQVVNQASTNIVVYSSENPSTYGNSITFIANVTSSGGSIPDGETVTFKDGSTTLGTGITSSGNATFSISTLGAGSHSITAVYAGDTNFSTNEGSLTQTVNKADSIISVNPYSVTYDGSAHMATGTATGVKGESLTGLNLSGTTHTNAGDYPSDEWTFMDSTGNYNSASGTVHDNISKIEATITVNGYTGVYDGNSHGASGTAIGVGGTDLSGSLDFGSEFTNVPGGTAHWTFTGGTNYNDASGNVNIVISKAGATIIAAPYSVTYDGSAHMATGTATGVKGESLSGLNLSGTTHTNAGDYPSDEWTFTDSTGNYNDETDIIHDTISKATLTVIANDMSREYGDSNPTLTGTIIGIKNPDGITATYSTSAVVTSPVGDYAIIPAVVDSDPSTLNNYEVTLVNGNLTITKATLIVTADNMSREYGEPNPAFTASYSGFKNGETLATSDVTGNPSLTTLATATSSISDSPYTIATEVGTLVAGNYDFSFVDGKLTITKATLTITADDASREYGDANPILTGKIEGIKNDDDITATYSTTADASTAVGTYAIIPAVVDSSPSTLGNYEITLVNGKLTITKATLIVTADDKSRVYGEPNPTFTVSYSGFKNEETLATSGVSGSPSLTTTANPSSTVSDSPYTITVALGTLASEDYEFSFINGSLAITKAQLTIIADNMSREYGDANPTLTGTIVGIKNDDGITATYSTSAVVASPVGDYAIVPAVVDSDSSTLGNYNVALVDGNLTVTKAETITSLNSSINPSVSAQSLNFTATVSAVAPGAGIPNGTMQFKIDGSNFGSPVGLSNGSATSIGNSSLSVGTHTITAEYSGDSNFNSSASSALTQTVNKASTTTPTTTTSSSAGSSSGSSGCGSGVITKENLSNIKQYETREVNVHISEGATVFRFATLGIVSEAGFTAKTNEGCIAARGEVLKERPSQATSDAAGTGTVYFNVWLGPSGYSESSKIENPYVVFSVSDEKNNESVKLMMYENKSWIDLKTEKIDTGTYKAYTRGFGSFAIVEATEAPSGTPAETSTQSTPTPVVITNEPAPQKPTNLALILVVFILIIGMVIGYRQYRKSLSRKNTNLQK